MQVQIMVIAAVAQRIARWTSNSKVVGSNPIGGVTLEHVR